MINDARADRTELRLRLYENGFTPLPNHNKMCLLEKWSTVTVTPELIRSREWVRSGRDKDTGIRCGAVIAIDWDVNDETLLNDLLDAIVAEGIIPESEFVRVGKPPREMWLFRTEDKIGKRTTGFFKRIGAGEDEKAEQVEILGGGCQFAAYGMRDETIAYTWPVKSLLDHRYGELPAITLAQVEAVRDFATVFFEQHGLERISRGGGTDEGYSHAYDLTDDMVFAVNDLGDMSVADLAGYFQSNPDVVLRCRVDVLRPGTSGSLAGMVSLVNGMVCISDHGSYTSHFPVDADVDSKLALLTAAMQEHFPSAMTPSPPPAQSDVDLDHDELAMDTYLPLDTNMERALKRFAFMSETNMIADVLENNTTMTVEHFRNLTAPYYETKLGPRGGETFVYLSKLWLEHKQRRNVRRAVMRPDQPLPFFSEQNESYVNTFRPLTLPSGGDASVGMDLIYRLLPNPLEARYFLQWLAYKVRFPDTRGPAVVMVAHDKYGTGRGSLIELLKQMWSRGLVRTVDFQTLTGTGSQGQYNEWLADALMVAINEAQETPQNGSKWLAKANAYEHLKLIVEPGSHELYVKRKGVSNYSGRTSASIIVMTNHLDSLVIPPGDRRFAILSNGERQPQEYFSDFHRWRADLRNVGAFVEALNAIDLSGYNPFEAPPMTQAKRDMIDAGASAIDVAMMTILAALPGALLTKDQLILKLEDYLSDVSVDFPENWQRMVDRLFIRNTFSLPGDAGVRRVEGRQRFVRRVREVPAVLLQDDGAFYEELAKNGPQGRTSMTSGRGSVISFTSRQTG